MRYLLLVSISMIHLLKKTIPRIIFVASLGATPESVAFLRLQFLTVRLTTPLTLFIVMSAALKLAWTGWSFFWPRRRQRVLLNQIMACISAEDLRNHLNFHVAGKNCRHHFVLSVLRSFKLGDFGSYRVWNCSAYLFIVLFSKGPLHFTNSAKTNSFCQLSFFFRW